MLGVSCNLITLDCAASRLTPLLMCCLQECVESAPPGLWDAIGCRNLTARECARALVQSLWDPEKVRLGTQLPKLNSISNTKAAENIRSSCMLTSGNVAAVRYPSCGGCRR